MAPTTLRQQRLAEWIERYIGARTLGEFASDITDATGWPIDYSRLGRYRNQKLQVGPAVVARFDAYARKRGLDPVDLEPRQDALSLEERAVLAAEAQVALMARQVDALEAIAAHLTGRLIPSPTAVAETEAWSLAALAAIRSPRPAPTP